MTNRWTTTAQLTAAVWIASIFLAGNDVQAASGGIAPLIENTTATVEIARNPVIDRSSATLLARVAKGSRAATASTADGMLSDGSVVALEQNIAVRLPYAAAKSAVTEPMMLGRIEIEGASATRLHVAAAAAGTVLWIAGSDDREFTRFVPSETATWTPSVNGTIVYIAAEPNGGEVVFSEVAHVASARPMTSSCLQDVACTTTDEFSEIDTASRAIANLHFVKDGKSYICTGALLNDAAGSRTPYVLTARHCIGTQEVAATVEAVWDMRSAFCGANRQADSTRSFGAELVVASEATDMALLKLRSLPANRVFLGTDPTVQPAGKRVYRISHADGIVQTFSSGLIDMNSMSCPSAPRTNYIYSQLTQGAVSSGASGSPLLTAGLTVVGQLYGVCGANPADTCANFNQPADGALAQSWSVLAPYLDPNGVKSGRSRSARH
jgi:S1-C subfamily serine protease